MDLEDKREITREAGEGLANKYDAIFLEVSAKLNLNIEQLFNAAVADFSLKNQPGINNKKGKRPRCVLQ